MSIASRIKEARDKALKSRAPRDQMELGKQVRVGVAELKDKGLSNAAIAQELGIPETVVRTAVERGRPISETITEEQTIWFPGIYSGRQGVYAKTVSEVSLVELVELVQKRAEEDGQWAIDNGHVGDNEDVMRKMMKWVSDPINIEQCVSHILKANEEEVKTVDFVCRDLANGSKWVGGSRD